jgi:hypothetical protein
LFAEIAAADPSKAWLLPTEADVVETFEPKAWHQLYFKAFDALRFDRTYLSGGMSGYVGETPISYMALSQYCRDNDIRGDDLNMFMVFINAVDAEHLAMQAQDAAKASKSQN